MSFRSGGLSQKGSVVGIVSGYLRGRCTRHSPLLVLALASTEVLGAKALDRENRPSPPLATHRGGPAECPQTSHTLNELLEKYAEHGTAQFVLPDVLELPPISQHGNIMEIAGLFGGPDKLREAVTRLQRLLYAA
jgi:hypothetical protein